VFYRLPPGGAGPELVRALLARLTPVDACRDPDLKRLDQVLAERLADGGAGEPWTGVSSLADEGRIRWAVLNLLGDGRIGELLDIGTGSGRMLRLLGARARQAVGVDISNPALAATRAALHAAGLHQCTLRRADMYALPFDEGSFDLVTFDEVLAAASRPEEALAEAARVLRPGGRLLVVDVSRGEGRVLDAPVLAAALKRAGLEELRTTPIKVGGASLLLLLARRKRKDAGLAA
jgi:SAM-dependent methyltransferase